MALRTDIKKRVEKLKEEDSELLDENALEEDNEEFMKGTFSLKNMLTSLKSIYSGKDKGAKTKEKKHKIR